MTPARLRLTLDVRYAQPARRANYLLRLLPRGVASGESRFEAAPFRHVRHDRRDGRGNTWTHVAVDAPHDRMTFVAEWMTVTADAPAWPDIGWEKLHCGQDAADIAEEREALDFAVSTATADEDGATAATDAAFLPGASIETTVRALMDDPAQAVRALRARGLAARWVSGLVVSPDGLAAQREWIAVRAGPGLWIACDGKAGGQHLRRIELAVGREPSDVSLLRAVAVGPGEASHTLRTEILASAR